MKKGQERMAKQIQESDFIEFRLREIDPELRENRYVKALRISKIEPLPVDFLPFSSVARITPSDSGIPSFGVSGKYVSNNNPQPGGYYVIYANRPDGFLCEHDFDKEYERLEVQE